VQWHPEQDAADRRLFEGLVEAARVETAPRGAVRTETAQ
jgi:gamma-glutamyl-gamma-aminobutyrate hydrolase PuuD